MCAMLGNMQGESTLNPAYIQSTNRWRLPNSAQSIMDVPNSVMQNFYREYYGTSQRAFGVGLVQWDGYTESAGVRRQKMVNYAIVNNFDWYDGWNQCYRLRFEQQNDYQYHFFRKVTVSGISYTFDNFIHSTASVSDLTKAWAWGYERNMGGPAERIPDAEWWYDYFTNTPPAPVPPGDPDQADPNEPYDPTNPVDPHESYFLQSLLPVIWFYLDNKKKGKDVKRPCLKM